MGVGYMRMRSEGETLEMASRKASKYTYLIHIYFDCTDTQIENEPEK